LNEIISTYCALYILYCKLQRGWKLEQRKPKIMHFATFSMDMLAILKQLFSLYSSEQT